MAYTKVIIAGELIEVEYDFTKGEEPNYPHYPGSPDKVEILQLTLGDVNIWNLIDPAHIEEIENDIIEQEKN